MIDAWVAADAPAAMGASEAARDAGAAVAADSAAAAADTEAAAAEAAAAEGAAAAKRKSALAAAAGKSMRELLSTSTVSGGSELSASLRAALSSEHAGHGWQQLHGLEGAGSNASRATNPKHQQPQRTQQRQEQQAWEQQPWEQRQQLSQQQWLKQQPKHAKQQLQQQLSEQQQPPLDVARPPMVASEAQQAALADEMLRLRLRRLQGDLGGSGGERQESGGSRAGGSKQVRAGLYWGCQPQIGFNHRYGPFPVLTRLLWSWGSPGQ